MLDEILRQEKQQQRPRPKNKRLRAALTREVHGREINAKHVVFDWLAEEVRQRDPQESRTVVAIMDGETKLRDLQELKIGRARFTGVSTHDRPHIKMMIEKYLDQLDVIVTPYTAKTKVVEDEVGLWAAIKKLDVGWFGIKPYSSGKLFKGNGLPGNPHFEEDCRLARLAIRYILCNSAITAPIPGMIVPEQVDNVALAVKERRELDAEEKAELERATDRAWANLPYHYRWLRDWEYV